MKSIALELKDWGFSLSDITMQVNIWHGELGYMVFPAGAKYMASKLPITSCTLSRMPGTSAS